MVKQCNIDCVGISNNGRVHFRLTATDNSFAYHPFQATLEQNREMLAIALAAITSGSTVVIQMETTTEWSEVWWIEVEK